MVAQSPRCEGCLSCFWLTQRPRPHPSYHEVRTSLDLPEGNSCAETSSQRLKLTAEDFPSNPLLRSPLRQLALRAGVRLDEAQHLSKEVPPRVTVPVLEEIPPLPPAQLLVEPDIISSCNSGWVSGSSASTAFKALSLGNIGRKSGRTATRDTDFSTEFSPHHAVLRHPCAPALPSISPSRSRMSYESSVDEGSSQYSTPFRALGVEVRERPWCSREDSSMSTDSQPGEDACLSSPVQVLTSDKVEEVPSLGHFLHAVPRERELETDKKTLR